MDRFQTLLPISICGTTRVETSVARSWFYRLTLRCDDPLSNVVFSFNLRPYATDNVPVAAFDASGTAGGAWFRNLRWFWPFPAEQLARKLNSNYRELATGVKTAAVVRTGIVHVVWPLIQYDKQPKAYSFRPLLKEINSRFLSQNTPYHAG